MRRLSRSVIAAVLALTSASTAAVPNLAEAYVSIGVSIGFAPPPLPVYEQPPIPGPGYIWTPGYWAWGDDDYYWVPGTWVLAPEPGYLWTPAWWGWDDGRYVFHSGYWGREVGFYGGIAYGFGYTGFGYQGGYWDHDRFFYNRTVNNISNVNITNVYNRTVNTTTITHVSYNGPGGVTAQPTPQQLAAQRQQHFAPTPVQVQHQQVAARDPALHATANRGAPPIAATARPALLKGPGVIAAARAGGVYSPPAHAAEPAGGRPMPPAQPPRTAFNNLGRAAPADANPPSERSARYAHAQGDNRPYLDSRPAPEDRPLAAYRTAPPPHREPPAEARANRPPPAEYRAQAMPIRPPAPEARAYRAPPAQYRPPPQPRPEPRQAPPAERRAPEPHPR